jgi:DNA/RNA endonuclease YhcR with UshA esterase domain
VYDRCTGKAGNKEADMCRLILVLALLLTVAPAYAATVRPADARAHVGETVTVEGAVSEVYTARRSDMTFIDMGGRYPNEAFTAVIFSGDAGKFADVHALEGKTVDITGPVRLYKGRPEIILHDAGQIKTK